MWRGGEGDGKGSGLWAEKKEVVSASFAGVRPPTARAENPSMDQLAVSAAALFPRTGLLQGEEEG